MAYVIKNLKITWDWSGDIYAVKAFNVAITPAGVSPTEDIVVLAQTGKEKFEHIFRQLTLEKDSEYTAWVQALYENKDSAWKSVDGFLANDDGTSTISTQKDLDEVTNSLGDLSRENMVEKAKLGETIIDNGYIKSDLITADNILTGTLDASLTNIINLNADNITAGTFDASIFTIGKETSYETGYNPLENIQGLVKNVPHGGEVWHFDKHLTSTKGSMIKLKIKQ
jgi:hypothetical protein